MLRLATTLLVLLAAAGPAHAANYGEACTVDADCTEGRAPLCAIYFTDTSFEKNIVSSTDVTPAAGAVRQVKGVCVECQSDCDCGVNQFCGIDADRNEPIVPWATIISTNTGNGITNAQRKQVQLDAQSFTGMKIKSVCRNYDVPGTRCKRYDNFDENAYAQLVVERSVPLGRDINVIKVPPMGSGAIPKAWKESADGKDANMFCGRINTFAPQFHTIVNLGDAGIQEASADFARSTSASTGNFFDTSAQCRTYTVSQSSAETCRACQFNQDFNTCTRPDSSCNCNTRNDFLCCNGGARSVFGRWSSWADPTDSDRRCSDLYPREIEGSPQRTTANGGISGSYNYRTCQQACQPSSTSTFDRRTCYNADASNAVLTANTNEATFCACVTTCETCVAAAGGCGKNPAGYDYNNPTGQNQYNDLYGTCSGPCTAPWTTTPTTITDNGNNAFLDQGACAPNALASTLSSPVNTKGTCLPACVDCLAAAHAKNCPNGNLFEPNPNGCPTVTPKQTFQGDACSVSGVFATPSGFNVDAPPIDWEGWCEDGSCKICKEAATRCDSSATSTRNRGTPQICRRGHWVSQFDDKAGTLESNNSLATLLSISVFAAVSMLLALGVLVATCISK
mmetsp:Transcript_61909/g.152442  ORF Transcript_61909/g.152442 Transcript_61909/m.152442 type:complete len:623 (-) Transcript_61909:53-1921(-)